MLIFHPKLVVDTFAKMMRLVTLSLAVTMATGFLAPLRQSQSVVSSSSTILSSPSILTSLKAASPVMDAVATPKKIYLKKDKEMPKVLGGLKIGLRELVVITGASSGLGLATAVEMSKSGKYFVIMAVRDVEKAKKGKIVFLISDVVKYISIF